MAACAVPVITGIGHEVDRSVADDVAHTAAKTPTACAQVLVARVLQYLGQVEGTLASIARHASRDLSAHDERIRTAATHATRRAAAVLTGGDARLHWDALRPRSARVV